MEMMRNWIMQIAGIIVLGAVCDAVMTDGEMKKYVKLVVGLVLTFAVIRPVVNFSADEFRLELPQAKRSAALEYKQSLESDEQQTLLRIYRQKLAEKIENTVLAEWNIHSSVQVEVEEENSRTFGGVKSVRIKTDTDGANKDAVIRKISSDFGVEPDNIHIEVR